MTLPKLICFAVFDPLLLFFCHIIIRRCSIVTDNQCRGGLFGGGNCGMDDSLLFFFLLLVVIFCNCGMFGR